MLGTVVILTALPIEYQSVRAYLINPREETHPKGNVYERGVFSSNSMSIVVGLVQIRKGNVKAGVQTERAISYFKPDVVFFVGVAGGLKDVRLGDVVAAEKVYGYESGKATLSFQARPDMGIPSFRMIERAQAEARKDNWLQQLVGAVPKPQPHVFIGPIAAGEKVVASKRASIYKFLKSNYGDSLAVEMEGYGFLEAAHANKDVDALVIRGISDRISGKSIADTIGWQKIASRHASAFAFAILSKLMEAKEIESAPLIPKDIQMLLNEGFALRNKGKYTAARIVFQKSLELSAEYNNTFAIAKAKYGLAIISNEWDRDPANAKELLKESLLEFKTIGSDKEISAALYQLGVIEIDVRNLDQAEAYLSQVLDIDKKNEAKVRIAQDLHQLGWIEDHRGHSKKALEFYDQALNYFLSIYQEGNSETEKDAIFGIAGCYQHKGLIYEHEGNVEEVESNYMRALEWHQKAGFKPDLGKILYLIARLKYREAQYNDGTKYLDEAMEIYNEIGDNTFYGKCLDLKGRMYFTLGHTDKAIDFFESALDAVDKDGNYKEKEIYLNKLGNVYLDAKKIKEAKGFFDRAKDLSIKENLLEGYEEALEKLAQIAAIEKNDEEKNRLLSEGIQTLEKLLLTVQAEPQRAFIMGRLGFFYEKMENFQQAIICYQKAKKAYEAVSNIGGIGNCLGSIARIKGLIGKKNEEFDTYRELKKLIDGTPYYDLIAGTAINLGEIQMQIGNLDEAKMLFREAEYLCRKYNLNYLSHVKKSIERLTEQIKIRKLPELDFRKLIHELFELTEWFPEAKDSILRLWMWGRKEALLGNYRSSAGVNLMVCHDNVDTFVRVSKVLHPFSDLCLQVVSSEFPGTGIDIIPFPMDKEIFFDCAIPSVKRGEGVQTVTFLHGGIHSRYSLTGGTTIRSKVTGNEGTTITGWSIGLPVQAHQLIFSLSAEELFKNKIFFLPYERHLANDKLLNDLSFCKEFKLIPIYFDTLPSSENIEVVTSKIIDIPSFQQQNDVKELIKIVRKIKRNISQLLSVTTDSAQSLLNDLSFSVEDLIDSCVSTQSIQIQVFILTYPDINKRKLHVAMVITNAYRDRDTHR